MSDMDFANAHLPSGDSDDDGDSAVNATIDDCLRMWRRAVEWVKHETIIGVRECATQAAGWEDADRDVWVESIQRMRESGLFDADMSYNLLHHIIWTAVEDGVYDTDAELEDIFERMGALCDSYDLPAGTDFTPWPDPPAEWTRLVGAARAREQEIEYEILRAAGEHEMVRLMTDDRAEFDRRIKVVENRIRRDHVAERER